jgi:2-methylisocitrate lyase-like PEP mutase family enzyme
MTTTTSDTNPRRADLAGASERLRALHRPGDPLVLVNVWDAASARRVEALGARAIGTSSAAVAASLGVPDDRSAPVGPLFDAVARISGAVGVPVTADVLDGYGLPADELVDRLLAAGAVGCNLEDTDHARGGGLVDAREMAERLSAVREAARVARVPLVVNARIDVLVHARPGAPDLRGEIVDRARHYLAAGADCAFPVRLGDPEVVASVVEAVGGPVNASAIPGTTVEALAAAGAARISVGPQAQAASLAALDAFGAPLLTPTPPMST